MAGPNGASVGRVVFAVSLPLSLGLDAAANFLPFGELFFFAGFGFYLGLGLLPYPDATRRHGSGEPEAAGASGAATDPVRVRRATGGSPVHRIGECPEETSHG